jgi:transposase
MAAWSKSGNRGKQSIRTVQDDLNLSELNLDGTHTLAKKGGESVAYQGRKHANTSNILPLLEGHGSIVASRGIVQGHHHDAFHLKPHLQDAFKFLKKLGLDIAGAFFNADSAFDTKEARKTCFNHGVVPNIPENPRNRKHKKRGRPRLYDKEVYKRRFVAERSFAWVDKFKSFLIRFERKDAYFLGAHAIAFAMINLRHIVS